MLSQPLRSSIYRGSIAHVRLRPRPHRMRYDSFHLLIDLDELHLLSQNLFLLSSGRFNIFSIQQRDHLACTSVPLREQINHLLEREGLADAGHSVRLLCMPRVLGCVFNPLSVFYCFDAEGALRAVLYEVRNTFGQRHCYLLPVETRNSATVLQSCSKCFYVSPFMDMAMRYRFRLGPPAERLALSVMVDDPVGTVMKAALSATRLPLTDANLLKAFLRYPMLALQVTGAIHWEALKLWRKGLKIQARPAPPTVLVSAPQLEGVDP